MRYLGWLWRIAVVALFIGWGNLIAQGQGTAVEFVPTNLYPACAQRCVSPGNTTYFINPVLGNDANSGVKEHQAWRTFKPVNARTLAAGDRVEILAPGRFEETLMPMGAGTREAPVVIHFAKGRYDLFPSNAIKLKLHVSNDNDAPYSPKAVALLFRGTQHFRVNGDGADLYVHGKMIEVMLDHATDVSFSGLSFDYHRPTVSEFAVLQVADDHADVRVHQDSTYRIEKGKLEWIGEGWSSEGRGLAQEYDQQNGRVWRRQSPLCDVTRVEELSPFQLRVFFKKNPGFAVGRVFQFRETFRDCVGTFILRSQNVAWKDCAFRFMHGLGVVSQFSENLKFERVAIAPRPGGGRTCAGWADLLHFSGCRGLITVNDCTLSGSNDDAINVHGTHLRVVGKPNSDQLLLRFMHSQSFGFEAFVPGDEIEVVNHESLRAYHTNHVKAVECKGDREVLLTLAEPIGTNIGQNDVVENVTWTPSLEVRGCNVSVDSCRGFLVSTRRPVVIEGNTFIKTSMPAVLIADDANSWFESGVVRDVTIRGNHFVQCAEPVIEIAPENQLSGAVLPVHKDIRVLNNRFELLGKSAVTARCVENLVVQSNRFSCVEMPIQTTACPGATVADNELGTR